jgi:transcriptional regulator GlxA family with amidase domain
MLTLGAILYPDFELLDLYGPLEMFCTLGEELKVITIADSVGPVASTQGPRTMADTDYANAPELDLLLIPGGIGTFPALENQTMLEFLAARAPACRYTMSVCTGSALLAAAGLLDGRRATSNKMFFSMVSDLREQVQWVENARWVVDGQMVTSSGVSAGTDMALAVIADLFGQERAEQIAIFTEYQWHQNADSDPFAQYLNQGTPPAA